MGYLIDTCIWIDVEQGKLSAADVASFTGREAVFLCPIILAELKFGAEISSTENLRQKRLAALAKLVKKPLLKIDEGTADIFGSVAASLKKSKRDHQYRIQDLWIAAIAIQYNLKLITHNQKDFKDIPGLEILAIPPTR